MEVALGRDQACAGAGSEKSVRAGQSGPSNWEECVGKGTLEEVT